MELNEINPYVLKVMPSAMRKFDHDISVDPKIIKLTLGEPNFNVPDHIKQAAIDAINDNKSHYPYYWGYQEPGTRPQSIIVINLAMIIQLIKLL